MPRVHCETVPLLTNKVEKLRADHSNWVSVSANRYVVQGLNLGPHACRYMLACEKQKSGQIEERTVVEEIKCIVRVFIRMCSVTLYRIPSPDEKDGDNKCASMSQSRWEADLPQFEEQRLTDIGQR